MCIRDRADIAQDNSQEYPTVNCTYISGHTFRFGNYSVDCTATDAAGNYAVHTFHVAIIDEEIPSFLSQPEDILVETDPWQPYAHIDWALPSVFDNSMEEVFINSTHHPNTTFPIGVTTVTYWAFDLFKNVNTFSFNITVIDMEYPVFYNLTQNISVLTEERVHYAHVSWDIVDVWDNSGEPLNITSDYHPGDIFYVGETWVTYTAIDKSGNIDMYSFSILVIDKELPEVIYCPPDITIETWYRSPYVNVTWTSPNITDNVGVLEIVSNYHSGYVFHLGVTTVVYNATDTAFNFNHCHFNITVIDVEKPYFENCSLDIAVPNIPGSAYSNVTWTIPTAYDNSQIPPHVTSDADSGDVFPLYDTIVTYTAVDESNNVELCRFKVTDNRYAINVDLPYFTNFTDDVQVFLDSIHSNVTVDWDPPYPADNSGVLPLLESTHQPGDTFQVGVTMVTYTATDETGNTMIHTFTVKIRVAFTDLKTILFNGTDDVDILQVSAIAVDRGKGRDLTDNEIDDLEVMLLSMSSASEDVGNREPKVMTEEIINVTTTVIDRKKNMVHQIDLVLASEILLKEIVTRQTNTTLKKSSKTVASNIEPVENAIWSFHFQAKEKKLDSSRDNSKKAKNNAKGFVRVDPSSAKNVPESAAIIVTYYDKVLFEESEGDEKSDVTFQPEA
ncbi:hyalin-like, partial [Anneissia japonica]|uniref:hyalin-like n=1 Tax=Anneissia japonica TaxID=1529436 RepID=UPI0014258710